MKYLLIALIVLSSVCNAKCIKDFEGVTLQPSKSGSLPVPKDYHESYMTLKCDIENLDYIPYEPAVFLAGNSKVVMTTQYMKDFQFSHKHIYGESDILNIPLKSYDDMSRILFYNCRSSCY